MKFYKRIVLAILGFIVLNSCYFTPKYTFNNSRFIDTFILDQNKKHLLIKNNFHSDNIDFRKKIDDDFKRVVGDHLYFENSIIDFDNNRPILVTPYLIDLLTEAYSSQYDYVLFLTFVRVPENESDLNDKIVSIKKTTRVVKRNYNVILTIVDLKERKIVYCKEAISSYNKYLSTGITTSPFQQIEGTFNVLFKDFEKKLPKKKSK